MRKLAVGSGWLLSVAAFAAGGFIVLSASGKYNLENQAANYAAEKNETILTAMAAPGKLNPRQDVWIRQDGEILQSGDGGGACSYNDDILTFLLIGIGREETEDSGEDRDNAQVKALALVVLDSHEKAIKLIPISCNTMTTVDVYDGKGNYAGTVAAQVGVRYGFNGDGRASCGYQVKAVQELFYGIPINGYLAADMEVVSEVAALINGMDVGASKDLSKESREEGKAYLLAEFIGKGIRLLKEEPTFAMKIYHEMSDRITTDITADEAAYLAAIAGGYCFDEGGIITIPGIYDSGEGNGESGCDGFYVDKEAFYRLVLDIFYEPAG